MKIIMLILFLFCLQGIEKQDSVRVQKPMKMFFTQKTVEQRAEDISIKLDSLIAKLQNDSTKIK